MAVCYILYSTKLKRFYIGASQGLAEDRLQKHNDKNYGSQKYTAKAEDWKIVFEIRCNSFVQAKSIERHIKSMKSKIYINNLQKYPEMVEGLKARFPA
jgi:putative endonuclease